jgi:hypothetical protein
MMQKKKHAHMQIAERIRMYRCSTTAQNIALEEKPQNELEYIYCSIIIPLDPGGASLKSCSRKNTDQTSGTYT